MEKKYLEHLAEWIATRETAKKDKNLLAFLAVRDDVAAALAIGYSVKTVWADLREAKKITASYETFLHYVNRHIRKPVEGKGKEKTAPLPAGELGKKATTLKTFVHNPNPRKEDLF